MRVKLKRTMAAFLSVLVAFSMLVSGQAPMLVKAANATITVSFQNDADASEGKVEVYTGSEWTTCVTGSGQGATAVRIVPNAGYRIDWTATRLQIGENSEEINNNSEIQNQLASDSGYSLIAGTTYSLSGVEFAEDNSGGGGSGGQITLSFPEGAVVNESAKTITYTVEGQTVTVTASSAISGGSIVVPSDNLGSVIFTLDEHFDSDTMQVKVYAGDGFNTELTVTNNETSLAKKNNGEGGLPDVLQLVVESKNSSGGGNNPEQPGQGVSEDFTVKIGEITVYQANAAEGDKINVPNNALYDLEETEEGIAIKPKEGTDVNHNPEEDIATKPSLTLDPIVVTGNGRVEVYAGLNYTPAGVEDGSHIEEDVPIIIRASASTGYSFEADGDVDFSICWGNFRSTATLEGGVKARGFSVTDLYKLTIGTDKAPVQEAFCAPLRENSEVYESSYVEFNLAETYIYANKAFTNYHEVRAWDEAAVTVNASTMFDSVEILQVQTGGKFDLTSTSEITVPNKVQAGYYTEIGQILPIQDSGRFQDAVTIVDCQKGDFSKKQGRYKYTVSDDKKSVVLESTTKTLWALGYSFLPESGDQYVKNGHFEISAGSGLVRENTTEGGEYWFEAGTEVTFKLVPDTGYRYVPESFKFNGDGSENVVNPTNDPGVYIFTMPSNPIHVSCEFAEAEAEIDVAESGAVNAADIEVPDGAIYGVAKFDVKSKELSSDQEGKFAEVAGDMELGTALDLSLNQVIDKIGSSESWITPVTELKKPMTVTLGLESSLGGHEVYTVVRQHGDVIESLNTKYDSRTNSITFETDRYSTYAIAYKGTAGSTGGSSGGITTPSGGTTADNTTTETKPDGTKAETSTETKTDGTKVETTVETKTDGTKTETVVETAKDGSVKTTETVTNADGSSTKTQKETETNAKGKEVEVTTVTQKDTQGNVAGITETSVIENIVGKADATVTVEKSATGEITSAQAEVNKNGSKSKSGVKGTLNGSVVSQIAEAAGTKSVEISMTVTAGEKEYTVKADAGDITVGNKLKVMAIDPETGNYILVNAKTYTVSKAGSVSVTLPAGATYQLLDSKEAAAVEKKILATVKVKKTSTTVEKGKKTSVQMSSKLDMDNVESITYSTSKKSVATVSKSGKVTAKNEGTVTITVTVILKNGKTKTVKMKINVK